MPIVVGGAEYGVDSTLTLGAAALVLMLVKGCAGMLAIEQLLDGAFGSGFCAARPLATFLVSLTTLFHFSIKRS